MYHLLIFYFLEFYQGKLTVSCFSKDHRKVFSNMALRLGKKLLFAVMVEFTCCNDIYKLNKRQLIPFQYF